MADLRRDGYDAASHAADTRDALHAGVEVIYQGALVLDDELGMPDFLIRSDLLRDDADDRRYEVVDAKLAWTAKARAVLQTTFYSRLLGAIQGAAPRFMHLALGTREMATFRVAE